MRVIVYGAGAIGSTIGGYLHHSGQETILVGSQAHVDAIVKRGLTIRGVLGDFELDVPAVADASRLELRDTDIVFLTMKTYDTEAAIAKLGEKARQLVAVCFQNSVRNEEIAAPHFARVYGGIAFFGAKYLKPGVVIHTVENSLGIGLYPKGLDQTVERLADVLARAGFAVTSYSNIMAVKWAKLFRNLNNSLFAITGQSVLEGVKHEESRFLMADLLDEALRVVKVEGIEIVPLAGHHPPAKMIESLRKPGERDFEIPDDEEMALRPSTWQDLYLKRGRTEVEYLNGEIVRLGEKHGVPTPLNSLMVRVINRMAQDKIMPGAYTAARLREMAATGE
jgi:2-dehydropantoate 2-reductase